LPLVCLPGAENRAQVVGGEIILRSKQPLPEEGCKALLEKMFAQLLPPLVAASLSRFWPLYAPFLDLAAPPQVKTRKMISRWGVCRPLSNEVCFSKRLVHLPRRLIDYVVVHELCHFRFFDHGPRFWRLVEKGAPDWRECRRELNRMDAYIDI
jgi:predicted metal-dependent hydrolase